MAGFNCACGTAAQHSWSRPIHNIFDQLHRGLWHRVKVTNAQRISPTGRLPKRWRRPVDLSHLAAHNSTTLLSEEPAIVLVSQFAPMELVSRLLVFFEAKARHSRPISQLCFASTRYGHDHAVEVLSTMRSVHTVADLKEVHADSGLARCIAMVPSDAAGLAKSSTLVVERGSSALVAELEERLSALLRHPTKFHLPGTQFIECVTFPTQSSGASGGRGPGGAR